MRKYEIKVIITEGNDEFWEEIEGSGCDEVLKVVRTALFGYGFQHGHGTKINLVSFEDTRKSSDDITDLAETVTLTRKEFADLPEYSLSAPTDVKIGKAWKAFRNGRWCRCEYVPTPNEPGYADISVQRIRILEE